MADARRGGRAGGYRTDVDATKEPSGDVTLRLSYPEAVVLADMLWRWERDGTQDRLPLADQAERRVIWDLTASFEPVIDEVLDEDGYEAVVARSRSRVRDPGER
jgi:hypothetical protein